MRVRQKMNKKETNEVFDRLRSLELKDAEQEKDINSVIKAINEVKDIFKEHDDKEMKKYEQTDNSIKQMNDSIIKVNENLNSINSSIKTQSIQINELTNEQKTHKDDVDKRLDKQDEKINKILGGLILASIILGLSWQIYTYFSDKFERQENLRIQEMKASEAKIKQLENYVNRNKGSLDAVFKTQSR